MPLPTLLQDLVAEVNELTVKDLHPKVSGLVASFLAYLKEPRYQNPLTLSELKKLFDAFNEDLVSLVFHIYTQLNTNKRQLLQKSRVFKQDPVSFDYLNAIANYSTSSVKLSKRTDPLALYQLRVFGLYKFLTIFKTMELAHSALYSTPNPADGTILYDKVFRFDLRDIEILTLLTQKIEILRQLDIPLDCFFETEYLKECLDFGSLNLPLEQTDSSYLVQFKEALYALAEALTPSSKLDLIVNVQKLITQLCASSRGNDHSKVSNDVLLPAFIYNVVKYSPLAIDKEPFDLFLQITFVKNFWKPFDPHSINASRFTLNSSLQAYNPMEKRNTMSKNNNARSLEELLNLESSTNNGNDFGDNIIPEFSSNANLMSFIHSKYLNLGESQFYLTNCEAILSFLISTPISEIVPRGITIPPETLNNDLINLSLHDILHKNDEIRNEDTKLKDPKALQSLIEEEFDDADRSRSSSLFNTISSAVSQSVNRSRSNSGVKGDPFPNTENHPSTLYLETSIKQLQDSNEAYGLNRVRSIFERISLVSNLQAKAHEADKESIQETVEPIERTPDSSRTKRSHSLFDKLSPGLNRNRSGSLELWSAQGSSLRRATLSSKFSSGMTELMTKISSATGNSSINVETSLQAPQMAHAPLSSVQSIEDPFGDAAFPSRELLGNRSSSLQTMEKWFCNIPENNPADNSASNRSKHSNSSNRFTALDSHYNEGSVFSASFGELTKYHFADFESMTINDLKNMKIYYDQLCSEVLSGKSGLKTSNEFLPEDHKDQGSNSSSLVGEENK